MTDTAARMPTPRIREMRRQNLRTSVNYKHEAQASESHAADGYAAIGMSADASQCPESAPMNGALAPLDSLACATCL